MSLTTNERLNIVLEGYKEHRITMAGIAAHCDIGTAHLNLVVNGKRPATLTLIKKLQRGLRKLEKGNSGTDDDWKFRLYSLVFLHFSKDFDEAQVLLAQDPARRANKDPVWLKASQIREIAIYILNTEFSVSMRGLAPVLNITAPAVLSACRRVEDRRSADPKLDATLDKFTLLFDEFGRAA